MQSQVPAHPRISHTVTIVALLATFWCPLKTKDLVPNPLIINKGVGLFGCAVILHTASAMWLP